MGKIKRTKLTLFPIHPLFSPGKKLEDEVGTILCRNRLDFDRDPRIFEHIESLKVHPIPSHTRFEISAGHTSDSNGRRDDNLGDELTFVYPYELLHGLKVEDTSLWNQAIVEFVEHLYIGTPIILFWW